MTKQQTIATDTAVLSLEQLVEFARRHSSYYARHYRQVPHSGWQISDLPLVNPRDYWEGSSELTNWPVLTGPFTDGIVFKTGGTTGASKLSIYTRSEWRTFVTSFGRNLASQLQPGDRVANLFFAGDLYSSFLFIHDALAHMDIPVCEYPFSGAMESQVLFDQLNQHKINVLLGVPAMLLQFAAIIVAQQQQLPGITLLLFGCESIFAEQMLLLKQAFPNARVASVGCASVDAGLIGASTPECLGGEHRVFEPETIVEIIDEVTGESILEEGRTGMLIITTLTRKLMPLIRYPVGDLAAWREPPGKSARKFILQGRSSLGHRIRVGYASVFPDEFDFLITEMLGRQLWQLILDHHDHCEQLTLRIAFTGSDRQADALWNSIQEKDHSLAKLCEAGQLRMVIEWCRQDELICNSRTGKLQRVIDRRRYVTEEAGK
ncbi:phenylacetate--CoA ligase family protein [Salmonella enterica subsp. houtenae serovar 44:z36,[z38]:-]|uniref:Phenylacetate--CoA ligase family protein n=3 Tax=Salmonella enterica TaxID=28901 RepID=A0A5V0BAT4_SALEN|nr:phenylacetate--CoA ligase family protein [Salmonella enterica]EAC0474362.1 phenylacetate--CoA ligase family protein [Salmonella enterica subsp. enterica serovar Tornow]EBR9811171.1 phenylacetate--CoA ligase family protein [Salmonella enterica subsp. enterica serovar Teshie]EBS5459109.1 phenylacetate--CoA ligase family protein [Salmonella enterica subsp. enterica serovar Enteritidis]ECA7542239.1 phenylacetate--CoA ligase family protein [Salmonella enterica subsp. enterica serovar Strasbourg]